MDRDIPTFNRVIMSKIQQQNLQIHYRNLLNIKKSKNNKISPPVRPTNKINTKGLQLQQQKQTEIDKTNVMLFQKMTNIMKRNDPLNCTISHRPTNIGYSQDVDKIYADNKKLVERISNLKPTIDHKRLHQQRQKQLKFLKFIGKYAPQNKSFNSKMRSGHQSQNKKRNDEHNDNQRRLRTQTFQSQSVDCEQNPPDNWNLNINMRPKYHQSIRQFNKAQVLEENYPKNRRTKQYHIHSTQSRYQNPLFNVNRSHEQSSRLQSRNINLFKKIRQLDNVLYSISIVRTHQNYQIICQPINQIGRKIKLEFDQVQGKSMLQSIDYDYEILIENLSLENQKLQINSGNLVECKMEYDLRPKAKDYLKLQIKKTPHMMMLPSHITEINEDDTSIHHQTIPLNEDKQTMKIHNETLCQNEDAEWK